MSSQPPRIFTSDYYARLRELEASSWWNEGMRDIAEQLLRRARLGESGVMLDAGCGSGQTIAWFLNRYAGWRAAGLDLAFEAARAAQSARLAVACASTLSLPIGDNSVDLVISLDVLQHLPLEGGDLIAAQEFFRVLHPGGLILVRTNAQSFPRTPDDHEASFRKYDRKALRRVLAAAGFEILVTGRSNALLGLAEISRDIKAARHERGGYHGVLSQPGNSAAWAHRLKRAWLRFEGKAVTAGLSLPLGRTLFALCKKPHIPL